ncbi:hypothetical protein [Phenylobacterium sp.]|uniref:hypothetical protein n=2 Tax=Phenylobacterium sp. TaxID=1871053 RepID=UPI002735CE78|nr:hypothetical protein [Phenylobacterium sp.]
MFVAAKATKRAAPYGWDGNVRKWMGKKRYLAPYQHGHHWALSRNEGIGRYVPDAIKNQPWNIKPMPSPKVHGRIHGPYAGKKQFNPVQRYWYGTPAWSKVGTVSAAGHPTVAAKEKGEGGR